MYLNFRFVFLPRKIGSKTAPKMLVEQACQISCLPVAYTQAALVIRGLFICEFTLAKIVQNGYIPVNIVLLIW